MFIAIRFYSLLIDAAYCITYYLFKSKRKEHIRIEGTGGAMKNQKGVKYMIMLKGWGSRCRKCIF